MKELNLVCIICPMGCRLTVTGEVDETGTSGLNVTGGRCKKGVTYAYDEITNPVRMICSTVKITGGIHSVIPVKTDRAIPEKYRLKVVETLNSITLASPVKMGDIILADIFGTGVNVVAQRNM